jgi:hypothetical protein
MVRTYHGVVRDHVVVLDDSADLADGTEVEVRVLTNERGETDQLTPGSRLAQLLLGSTASAPLAAGG